MSISHSLTVHLWSLSQNQILTPSCHLTKAFLSSLSLLSLSTVLYISLWNWWLCPECISALQYCCHLQHQHYFSWLFKINWWRLLQWGMIRCPKQGLIWPWSALISRKRDVNLVVHHKLWGSCAAREKIELSCTKAWITDVKEVDQEAYLEEQNVIATVWSHNNHHIDINKRKIVGGKW